jgi:hypothetical protein
LNELLGAGIVPKMPLSNHLAVVTTTADTINVVPAVLAPNCFTVRAFVSDAKIDDKPRQMPPQSSSPTIG